MGKYSNEMKILLFAVFFTRHILLLSTLSDFRFNLVNCEQLRDNHRTTVRIRTFPYFDNFESFQQVVDTNTTMLRRSLFYWPEMINCRNFPFYYVVCSAIQTEFVRSFNQIIMRRYIVIVDKAIYTYDAFFSIHFFSVFKKFVFTCDLSPK